MMVVIDVGDEASVYGAGGVTNILVCNHPTTPTTQLHPQHHRWPHAFELVSQLDGHAEAVLIVDFNNRGTMLATCSHFGLVRVWWGMVGCGGMVGLRGNAW